MTFFSDKITKHYHLMVDLETLAVHPAAPILAIGAVLFDPHDTDSFETLSTKGILLRIDPANACTVCGPVDGGTLRWWFSQEDAAIKALIGPDMMTVRNALTRLLEYAQGVQFIWAKSPDFDCSILKSACDATNVRYPFGFWNQRCVRTALDLAFPNSDGPKQPLGIKHNAKDDAVNQALAIQCCYAALGQACEPPKTLEYVRT